VFFSAKEILMAEDSRPEIVTLCQNVNVRKVLNRLRTRWARHSPASPFCMTDELEEGVSIADFCVYLLLTQRSRRTPFTDSVTRDDDLETSPEV